MYTTKWRSRFCSLTGEVMTIEIMAEDWKETPIDLTAGTDPIVTDEDDDDDPLKGVRSQTGNLRLVLTDEQLQELMPTDYKDRPVRLRDENGLTKWRGWIKPSSYSNDWIRVNDVVRVPIISDLELLKYMDMPTERKDRIDPISRLIIEMQSAIVDPWQNIWVPDEVVRGEDRKAWLSVDVYRYNFVAANDSENADDPDYQKYTGASMYDVLEELMKVWGWTAMERNGELWIASKRKGAKYVNLYDDYGGEGETEEYDLNELRYTSDAHTISIEEGRKSVKVTAEVNSIEPEAIDLTTDGMDRGEVSEEQCRRGQNDTSIRRGYLNCKPGASSKIELMQYDGAFNAISAEEAEALKAQGQPVLWARIEKSDIFTKSDLDKGTKKNYDLKDRISVVSDVYASVNSIPELTLARITSVLPMFLDSGCLEINYNKWERHVMNYASGPGPAMDGVFANDYATTDLGEAFGWVKLKLKVGTRWWNGEEWTSTESTFTPKIEDMGAVADTKTLDMPYNGATGYIIPIDSMLSGIVTLDIIAPQIGWILIEGQAPVAVTNRMVSVDGLSLRYVAEDSVLGNGLKKQNTYSANLDAGVKSETITLSLATKTERNAAGYGEMMIKDAQWNEEYLSDQLTICGKAQRPEKALLQLMKETYERPKEVLEIMCQGAHGAVCRYIYGEKEYVLLSQSMNWWDGEQTIKIREI